MIQNMEERGLKQAKTQRRKTKTTTSWRRRAKIKQAETATQKKKKLLPAFPRLATALSDADRMLRLFRFNPE